MRALILGGAGFIGTNLSNALVASGHHVRVFERPNVARPDAPFVHATSAEWVEGDFDNIDDVAGALRGCDVVFHLIGTTLPKTSNDNPAYDVESNLLPTVRMLDAARAHGVGKVIFVSSGGTVYGIPRAIPIPESHETNPLCSYGIVKLATEKYLHLYHHLHGLDYTVLRVSNPFGEYQRGTGAQGAVAVFLHRALEGQRVEIWGDGSVVRDFVYVGDVVDALIRAMTYTGAEHVFNVGSGVGRTVDEILDALERQLGRPVDRVYKPGRPVDVPINVLDASLAHRELGWRADTSLDEGIRRAAIWMEAALEATRRGTISSP